jgi:membrane protein implicated in regulation of membrane protease activity
MPESSATVPASNAPSDAAVLFNEKLWPNAWIWLVAAGLSSAGILVFAPISIAAGITAGIVLFVIIAVLLVLSTPTITVTRATLRVGRATIERRFLGAAAAFRGNEATAERGTRLNGLAFTCFRGWVDPVVRIEIADPSDRTPYWLTSTRRPDQLLAALQSRH